MSSSRPLNILLITRNYPPLTGGMERLMQKATEGMDAYADLTLIGPRGCRDFAPSGATVYEVPPKLTPFLFMSVCCGILACFKNRFDIILGGSGLAAPTLAVLRFISRTRTGLFLHGLDLVVNSAPYQRVFVPCIRRASFVVANSANTRELAIQKGVAPENISIINPGTDMPDLSTVEPRSFFFKRNQIAFDKVLIFVGRMTRRKGLSHFIRNSFPAILSAQPRCGLLIVGDNPDQGLTNFGERDAIKQAVADLRLQDKICFLGHVNEEDLISYYAHADVQIFPLVEVSGDVEGFGMVAVEAAACGTPTVAFDTGGVSDAISDLNGYLVESGRYDTLTEVLIRTLSDGLPTRASCLEHASRYRWETYHGRLEQVLRDAA